MNKKMQSFDILSELDNSIFDGIVGSGMTASCSLSNSHLLANTCFPGNTKVKTDQGRIRLDALDPSKHTVNGKKIVAVTRTKTLDKTLVLFRRNCLGMNVPRKDTYVSQAHGILRDGRLVRAIDFVGRDGVVEVPYNGCVLFNVLLEEHATIHVNNLICETLHPDHRVAKMYRLAMDEPVREQFIKIMNHHFLKELSRQKRATM